MSSNFALANNSKDEKNGKYEHSPLFVHHFHLMKSQIP